MTDDGDMLRLGKAIRTEVAKIDRDLLIGLDLTNVSDQAVIVEKGSGRLHGGPVRGDRHRSGRELPCARHPRRPGRRRFNSYRARHDVRDHVDERGLLCSAFRSAP